MGQHEEEKPMTNADHVYGDKHETRTEVHGDIVKRDKVLGNKYETHIHRAAPKEPPLQIPRRARYFQGREKLIADVLAELQPGRVVSLVGMGGIGKTAVTAEVVHQLLPAEGLPQQFPDGIIFYSFYGKSNSDLALEHILNSLGIEREGNLDDHVRAALGGNKLLLILDGAEEADHLPRIVCLAPSCAVLISSRKKKDVFDLEFSVKRLEVDKAEAMLTRWAGNRIDDTQARREICELVGNLPLALRLAGEYMNTSGLKASEYFDWLRESGLEALDFGQRREESVPVLLTHAVAQVEKGAQQALAVAGKLALAPFEVGVLAAALGKSIFATHKYLGELVNYGFLERPLENYSVTHPLVHNFARTEMALDQQQLLRMVDYYNNYACEQSAKGPEGFARLDHERLHIMQLIKVCKENKIWEAVDRLVWVIQDYLDHQGHVVDRIAVLTDGLIAERATGSRQNEAKMLGNLGNTYYSLGQIVKAIEYYEQALAIAQEIGDRRNEGGWLANLGVSYASLGQLVRAIKYYERALTIAREAGDRAGEGAYFGSLANAYYALGQVAQAITYYEQALTIAQETGDRRNEGGWLANLGNAYRILGESAQAIDFYEQALVIARQVGDKRGEGADLASLGMVYRSMGQESKATECLQMSLTIFEELNDPNTASVRSLLEDLDEG